MMADDRPNLELWDLSEGGLTSATRTTVDTYPPPDTGLQAWLLLAGCFVINIMIWGFSFSFGVLQDYYMTHEPFMSAPAGIPAIGTTATGLMYLLMPLYFSVLQRWPMLKRYSCWASLPLLAAALIGASFAANATHLLICQGIVFALAGNMLFVPTVTYLDEWFVRRKGLAIGIMWAGDGAGGVLMPLILNALLSRYGFRVALRAIACSMVLFMAPLLVFVKPRLPVPASSAARPINLGFLREPLFWSFQVFNIIQGSGYFLPPNYLPSYASSIGLSTQLGSSLLVLINAASVVGCIGVGSLMDRTSVYNVVLVISFGASTAIFAAWGFSTSTAPLLVFSLLYGVTAGSYSTSWTGMIQDIQKKNSLADANVVFGCLAAGRGIGAVVSGPLSESLFAGSISDDGFTSAYDSRYRSLIFFSGLTAFVGGMSWLLKRLGVM